MSANVETMFYTCTKPWHGLGTLVAEAPTSAAALQLAGLDWRVIQKKLCTEDGIPVQSFKANVRETDNQVLGVVTDRYKVVQNADAFAFTDSLLGEGVTCIKQCRFSADYGKFEMKTKRGLVGKEKKRYNYFVKEYSNICVRTNGIFFWQGIILIVKGVKYQCRKRSRRLQDYMNF